MVNFEVVEESWVQWSKVDGQRSKEKRGAGCLDYLVHITVNGEL